MASTVNFPGKLTEQGTEGAKNGLSMADMIAQIVSTQVAQAVAGLAQGGNGGGKPQSAKGKPAAKVASGPVKRSSGVSRTVKAVAGDKPVFNAREYFSLGPAIAATEDGLAYVAESQDETFGNNPIVFVGVQRKAICLNVDKARILYGLLEGYFTAPDSK